MRRGRRHVVTVSHSLSVGFTKNHVAQLYVVWNPQRSSAIEAMLKGSSSEIPLRGAMACTGNVASALPAYLNSRMCLERATSFVLHLSVET